MCVWKENKWRLFFKIICLNWKSLTDFKGKNTDYFFFFLKREITVNSSLPVQHLFLTSSSLFLVEVEPMFRINKYIQENYLIDDTNLTHLWSIKRNHTNCRSFYSTCNQRLDELDCKMNFCHVIKAVVSFNLEIGKISSLALTNSRVQKETEWRKHCNIDFLYKKCLKTYLLYPVNTIKT